MKTGVFGLLKSSLLVAATIGGSVWTQSAAFAQTRDTALERQAAHYIQYREDVAVIEATPLTSAETTREAHRRLSAHQSGSLSAGWVAYAALVAADTPEFAAALREQVEPSRKQRLKRGELEGRDGFLAKISKDPSFLRKLPGADKAIERVLAMTVQDAARFSSLGEAFKAQAYALQKTRWGVAKISTSAQRLSDAENYARTRPGMSAPALPGATSRGVTAPSLASINGAWSPDWGAKTTPGDLGEHNADVIMDRVLALAARYAVTGVNEKLVSAYAKNDRSDQCLSMATLTLKQCIAATRSPFEEAFCLGEHALNDTAVCIGWVAGFDRPE